MHEQDEAEQALPTELALVGFPAERRGELRRFNYTPAIPILVRWLSEVQDRATKSAVHGVSRESS